MMRMMTQILMICLDKNIKYIPNRQGECKNTLADISKAKKILKFSPKIDIKNWIKNQKIKYQQKKNELWEYEYHQAKNELEIK